MSSRRVHAHVTGVVQGVSYRASTRRQAERLGLTGWVRNRDDGSVELVAEGPTEALARLIEWCRRGPPLAEVTGVQCEWHPATGEFSQFELRR